MLLRSLQRCLQQLNSSSPTIVVKRRLPNESSLMAKASRLLNSPSICRLEVSGSQTILLTIPKLAKCLENAWEMLGKYLENVWQLSQMINVDIRNSLNPTNAGSESHHFLMKTTLHCATYLRSILDFKNELIMSFRQRRPSAQQQHLVTYCLVTLSFDILPVTYCSVTHCRCCLSTNQKMFAK